MIVAAVLLGTLVAGFLPDETVVYPHFDIAEAGAEIEVGFPLVLEA